MVTRVARHPISLGRTMLHHRTMASSATPQKSQTLESEKKPVPATREPWYAQFMNYFFAAPFMHREAGKPPIPFGDIEPAHSVDQTTGEEKMFQLAFENGVQDPYCMLPIQRNKFKGTKDDPIQVPGFFNERLIACECEPNQNFLRFTTLYRGELKRCRCGYHYKLVDIPPFWEKIPKDDLLEIGYFRTLEEEGLLDDLLSGKLHRDVDKLPKIEVDEFGFEKGAHHHH